MKLGRQSSCLPCGSPGFGPQNYIKQCVVVLLCIPNTRKRKKKQVKAPEILLLLLTLCASQWSCLSNDKRPLTSPRQGSKAEQATFSNQHDALTQKDQALFSKGRTIPEFLEIL